MEMERLPSHVQKLFWDVDASKTDPRSKADAIIERVLNYGDLGDWEWLSRYYGKETVREKLSRKNALGRDNLRPESRRLASLIFKAQ